ncbi:uncharacterized protein LOC130975687 [Arachis stenosperma]|uniref:uncharacterized protein LOC130975687 n=1 Tax=Arachis stenosperma TaxID=217475 RepID=UPI0025AD1C42|nr:uncharacterized protein LOC130975687 [Arachis stenosperma]
MVKDLKNKHKLDMVGLIETKKQIVTRFEVARIWGQDGFGWKYVPSDSASGGLLLIWNDLVFKMNNCYKGERWLCVEGEELSYIADLCQVPCCFLGDFNEIVQEEERKCATSLTRSAEDFKNWIQDMNLVDMPLTDRKFTWFRGRFCSRIDRVLLSLEWLEEFPESRLRGGPRGLSDHCPIIVEDRKLSVGPRPFRSLDSWFTHKGFFRMVKEEWRGLGDKPFTDKLRALQVPLGRWHKDNFGEMDKKIAKFEEEIKRIDDKVSNGEYDETMKARRKALVTCCERWYVRKEVHWKQMSRSRHAKDIDKNTRYFHNIASARRWNNRICALVINGRRVRNLARIKITIREFYKELYHQEGSPMVGFRDGLVEKIDEQATVTLEELPSVEEIREAVWDCESSKAPGCDRYNMNFIKRCWG